MVQTYLAIGKSSWKIFIFTLQPALTIHTNQPLQSLNKKDMIPIVLSLQNKLNQSKNKVLVEIHKLSDNFSKLESKLSVTKQVNSLLPHRLVNGASMLG